MPALDAQKVAKLLTDDLSVHCQVYDDFASNRVVFRVSDERAKPPRHFRFDVDESMLGLRHSDTSSIYASVYHELSDRVKADRKSRGVCIETGIKIDRKRPMFPFLHDDGWIGPKEKLDIGKSALEQSDTPKQEVCQKIVAERKKLSNYGRY